MHDYQMVEPMLKDLIVNLQRIWIDPRTCYGLIMAIPEPKRHMARSPIALLKSVKCPEEIAGMKQCNIDDSVALVRFFIWLERQVEMGVPVTEAEAADEIDRLRSLVPGFFSLSFDTISCSGCNGGMIHYRAQKGQDAVISLKEMYLCDSGGQYLTGTTDVTRTVHFGRPTPEEKYSFTLVLKGHIALASLTFPEGTPGMKIDAIARMALWQHGMDYRHGTGHGVGAFLNVHEGPCGLSNARNTENDQGLLENMVLTIEPGFYKSKEYGIRIENDYFLALATVNKILSNPSVKFLKFEPLTFFPIQTKCLDMDLMTEVDIRWLNEYHQRTRDKLGDLMRSMGLIEESRWLMRETEPVSRAGDSSV